MNTFQNEPLQLAFDLVEFTNKNIFLTGKAGTGKTTFLHRLREHSPKRMIVVAPTGVAALNAGGVTIHSFFQMAFGPFLPDFSRSQNDADSKRHVRKFSRDKISIIRSIDLLIIDEISMVRADLLDGIDDVLRRFRDRTKPFGGVQLLMIGDLQQLAPVIKEDEWEMLRKYYDTGYFFSSMALKEATFISIELKHIYRQSDNTFINILNKVRNNNLDTESLHELNKRFVPDAISNSSEGTIILTTHNRQAQEINESRLNKLKEKEYCFDADIDGEFAEYMYPTEPELKLKIGAQVMFVRNDSSEERQYYNGKIGKITEFEEDFIVVRCPDDDYEINVPKLQWENMRYTVNEESKEIQESVIGTFTQFPLKLAWAITIHKSQGLTFEKAIIDAQASFAHGQVYVALSRCRTLEGLTLSSRINNSSVKNDQTVRTFTDEVEKLLIGADDLTKFKRSFQEELIRELFDFSKISNAISYYSKLIRENIDTLQPKILENIDEISNNGKVHILDIAKKFTPEINTLLIQANDIESDTKFQTRIKSAGIYFAARIFDHLILPLKSIKADTDNKTVKRKMNDSFERLRDEIRVKHACMNTLENGFQFKPFLDIRAKAKCGEIIEEKSANEKTVPKIEINVNENLFAMLKEWRDTMASELKVPVYMVLPLRSMHELAQYMPTSIPKLAQVNGLGKRRIEKNGQEIIDLIKSYAEKYPDAKPIDEIPKSKLNNKKKDKKDKIDTKQISLEIYQSGKNISEIAIERSMTQGTIETHLSHFIGNGILKINEFISPEKLEIISQVIKNEKSQSLSPIKETLGDQASYSEIRLVLKHIEYTQKISETI